MWCCLARYLFLGSCLDFRCAKSRQTGSGALEHRTARTQGFRRGSASSSTRVLQRDLGESNDRPLAQRASEHQHQLSSTGFIVLRDYGRSRGVSSNDNANASPAWFNSSLCIRMYCMKRRLRMSGGRQDMLLHPRPPTFSVACIQSHDPSFLFLISNSLISTTLHQRINQVKGGEKSTPSPVRSLPF